MQAFPEFARTFGPDARMSLIVDIPVSSDLPFNMNMRDGILMGGQNQTTLTLMILGSNSTTEEPVTAIEVEMFVDVKLNLTMQDLIIYPVPQTVQISYTNLTYDGIGMYVHDYGKFFQAVIDDMTENFNLQNKKGFPLADFSPEIGMIGGLIKNTTLSPYISDGWLYGGFSMYSDLHPSQI